MKKILLPSIFTLVFLSILSTNVNAVDLSKPFICPDISKNTIIFFNNNLHIGGFKYNLYNANTASGDFLTNTQFLSDDQLTLIELAQYSATGEIKMSMMKLSIPYNLTNPAVDFEQYKISETVTFDTKMHILSIQV
ncbi:MAG: hypothetical protein ACRC8Q_08385 [Aeromonas sp.]